MEPPPYNPNLRIAGIEATQAIQFFNLTGQGSGFAPDNSLPLVQQKTTVLRVYVAIGNDTNFTIPRRINGFVDASSPEASDWAINGPIRVRPGFRSNRANVDGTLNFRIPAWLCTGPMAVDVQINDEAGFTQFSPPFRSQLTFARLRRTLLEEVTDYRLRLFVVRIIYTGPAATGQPPLIGPPSEQDMVNTLSGSPFSSMYPISGINYTGSTIAEFNGDLRRGGSGCGAGWGALLEMLRKQRAASSSRDVVLGLLPGGFGVPPIPRNEFGGCGDYDGVAAAFAGDSFTAAHEIGHAYGRQHVICGNNPPPIGGIDTGYPTFGTFPRGSIGEYGFGTTFSTVISPLSTFDFMTWASQCPIQWVSPYTYQGLFSAIYSRDWLWLSNPSRAALTAAQEASVEREYLHLSFRMYRDRRVELLPSFHLSGVGPVPEAEGGPQSPVVFELRDAEGQVIGFHRCHLTDPYADPDGPYHDFHKTVPWENEVRSIRFLRDGEEVSVVDVEEQAPEITSRPVAELDDRRNRMRLEWEGQHDTEPVTYLVRYSNDGGENWLALAAGLTEPKFEVDLEILPGGERCVFQIAASSTVRTTVAETEPVSVPVKPRRPYIVSPEPNSTFLEGESVVLAGVGYSPDFETTPPDEVVWTSNVAGFIGYGHEVITETLAPGLHKITLGVTDGLGAEASDDVLIRIKPSEEYEEYTAET